MPDPLVVLPHELWSVCIAFAIGGQQAGPLELLMVSTRWATLLADTPSLWTQIYIRNGEDEIARTSAFLHLSKGCSLHVDIMTVLPTITSLQLIAENIFRVATISIRPGASDNNAVFPMEPWKRAASNILSTLSNNRLQPDVGDNSCFGIGFRENDQWYYRVILMQFTTAVMVTSSEQNGIISAKLPDTRTHFRRWKEHVGRCGYPLQQYSARVKGPTESHHRSIRVSADQDPHIRAASIASIVKLASYGKLQLVIHRIVTLLICTMSAIP
jgi:hypothetical protein